jgi:hypothetical protein
MGTGTDISREAEGQQVNSRSLNETDFAERLERAVARGE